MSEETAPVYLPLAGLQVDREVSLRKGLTLCPTPWPPNGRVFDTLARKVATDEGGRTALALATLVIQCAGSELRVEGPSRDLSALTVHAMWDAMLIGGLMDTEAAVHIASGVPIDQMAETSFLHVMTPFLWFTPATPPSVLSAGAATWLEANYEIASALMDREARFRNAIHTLWGQRCLRFPRARLAVLWSGIEGLFGDSSGEITFRIALYAARFAYPDQATKRKTLFDRVRKLYATRSRAVHGADPFKPGKGQDMLQAVEDSADLLRQLVTRCVTTNAVPDASTLAP